MPIKDEQIDKIVSAFANDYTENFKYFKRIIRSALLRAYNRGFEAGVMKAQEQMMEEL